MQYRDLSGKDWVSLEKETLEFWKKNQIFERSITSREGKPSFIFYEGPPSANGMPGVHHVMARAIKDIFCRYKTLQGYQVKRKAGWDTHGLPVELKVEKDLGITKEDIGKTISVEDYNNACKKAVMEFKTEWDKLTQRMGYWVDLENPYITFENNYIESIWHLLKKLYQKGLLYKGFNVQPYSPAAGTGLSSHELNLPGCYRDVKDTSITAQFKVVKNRKSNFLFEKTNLDTYILAWTTTPWTLPSNCALAIGKDIDYVQVDTYNAYTHLPVSVVLARDTLSKFFSKKAKDLAFESYQPNDKYIPYQIVNEFKGAELLEIQYEQLMPYVQPKGKAFVVIAGDFVNTEEGTGIVHTASIFGADDFRVCNQNNISSILIEEDGKPAPLVDKKGRFVKEVTDFPNYYLKPDYAKEGETSKDEKPTDVLIAILLKEQNKAFKVEKYEHSYPHCWRTGKPILYYPLDSWFVKTTAYKEKMISLNQKIQWKPTHTGTKRFGNWLENLVDWNLSRSRYWGTPLPIWRTEDGQGTICIGSIEELAQEVSKSIEKGFMPADSKVTENGKLKPNLDLHKPFIDSVILVSAEGKKMYREADVIDVWFDSGAMPFAQWHYPFENQDIFKNSFPADYISEGVDQTRGWFFTLHAIATMTEEQFAFKNVISTGLILDKEGRKMSKSLGNVVDPFALLEKYGADTLRWYMIENAPPWESLKFSEEGLQEVRRKFFGTLINTYHFFALYANLDKFSFAEGNIPHNQRSEMDQWIHSRLHSVIQEVIEAYDNYEPTKAARVLRDFLIDDVSNWYVRLNRKRFWKSNYETDKISAYQTLYECLIGIAKMASPIAPFYTETLYNSLNAVAQKEQATSIHLSEFPRAQTAFINKKLEQKTAIAQRISSMVHALRKQNKVKVRQPLSRILIPAIDTHQKELITSVERMICEEVNIKKIEFIAIHDPVLKKKVIPNFKKLGAQFKSQMKPIVGRLKNLSPEEIAEFEQKGTLEIQFDGTPMTFAGEDMQIVPVDIPGWTVASQEDITVALDLTITDTLKSEGFVRELVNKLQNLRKDKQFRVEDKVKIFYRSDDTTALKSMKVYKDYICGEVQATIFSLDMQKVYSDSVEVEDKQIHCSIDL